MTAPTPDAVAQAREKYDRAVASLDAIRGIEFDVADEEKAVEDAWAEVIAAVRAERVLVGYGRKLNDWPIATSFLQHTEQEAREAIKRLPWPADESTLIPLYADADILAALEAHP